MYKNLKIGTKILLCFASLAVLSLIMMVFTLICLNSVGGLAHKMFNGPLISTTESMGVRNDLNTIGKDLRSAILAKDVDAYRSRMDATKESMQGRMTEIEKAFGGDKKMVTDLQSAIDALGMERSKAVSALEKGDYDQATDIVLNSYYEAFTKASDCAERLYNDASQRASDFEEQSGNIASSTMVIAIILLAVNMIAAVILALMSTRSIVRPLKEVTNTAKLMAEGALSVDITYESKDELGLLADNFRVIIKGMSNIVKDISYLLGEMANSNFDVDSQSENNYIGDYKPILQSIRNINSKLTDTLIQINQSSSQVSSGSDQVSSGAQQLSQGTTEQASAIEELAATIGEISQQIMQTADNSKRAKTLTDEARQEVDTSNLQMQELVNAMQKISQSSGEIGKIIKTIEDIAFQTNILALNAAVEAARAGAAGKGFAVVADEVRNLASKSAEASKNTAALIENSIRSVEEGTSIADSTALSLQKVVEGTQNVVGIVEQITLATKQQAESVAQVTQGIDQISSVVQTNSATAEESAAASEELSGQAIMLKNLVGKFRLRGNTGSSYMPDTHTEYQPSHSYEETYENLGNKY